jgi:hypothetical protein
MSILLQRLNDLIVRLALGACALATLTFDRTWAVESGSHGLGVEGGASPQEMLVRLTTLMIAGSLIMIAAGFSTAPQNAPRLG